MQRLQLLGTLAVVSAEGLTIVFAGMMRTSSQAAALLHTSVSRIWTPHTSLPPATSTATSSGGAGTPSTSPTLSSTPSRIDSGGGTGNTLSTEYYFRWEIKQIFSTWNHLFYAFKHNIKLSASSVKIYFVSLLHGSSRESVEVKFMEVWRQYCYYRFLVKYAILTELQRNFCFEKNCKKLFWPSWACAVDIKWWLILNLHYNWFWLKYKSGKFSFTLLQVAGERGV